MAETAEVTTESIEESTESATTTASPSEGTQNTAQDPKPVFTDQQQHWIDNQIIPKIIAQSKRQQQADTKARGLGKDEREELEQFRLQRREQAEQQALDEQRKLEEQGEYKRIIEEKDAQIQKAIADAQQASDGLQQERESNFVENQLGSAISRVEGGIIPEMVHIAKQMLKSGVPILADSDTYYAIKTGNGTDNGNLEIQIQDGNGNRPFNSNGEYMSLEEALAGFVARHPSFQPANFRGGGSGASGGSNLNTVQSLQKELDDLTAQARKSGRSGDRQAMLKKQRELKSAQA